MMGLLIIGFVVAQRSDGDQGSSVDAGNGDQAPIGGEREVVDEGRCRWIGADMGTAWRMCGHACAKDEPWCPHHKARVFVEEAGR